MESIAYRVACRECRKIFEISFFEKPKPGDIPDTCYPCWNKLVQKEVSERESQGKEVSRYGVSGGFVRDTSYFSAGTPEIVSSISRTGIPHRPRAHSVQDHESSLSTVQQKQLQKLIKALGG